MKGLNDSKKKRFKMAVYTIGFLSVFSIGCVVVMYRAPELDLASVVTTSIAGILTIATMFIGSDGYRKSE